MTQFTVVVGGQFGSEAKGHVTWQVMLRQMTHEVEAVDILNIRVAGPNAGHTAKGMDGKFHAFRQLPMGALLPGIHCAIAAGSEIDLPVLLAEIDEAMGQNFNPNRLIVDPEATMLFASDHESESAMQITERLGSTGKGIGAARVARLRREPGRRLIDEPGTIRALQERGVRVDDVATVIRDHERVVIEGTQGYGLGLHAGFYPFCTSSDCTTIDFLAMARVMPRYGEIVEPIVVLRPYPIRVAGNSGPLKGETTWDMLGLDPEFTTVTKKMRRVGQWDADLALQAVYANGGPGMAMVAVTMIDQVDPTVKGVTTTDQIIDNEKVFEFLKMVDRSVGRARIRVVTTGPDTAVWL